MARRALWLMLPAGLLAAILAFLVLERPLDRLGAGAPPVEELTVETVRLTPGRIEITVRADGSLPVAIAQVQIDGAYRGFAITPQGPIGRLKRAQITLPYPWIEGEAHRIVLVTSSGATFAHEIEVAQEDPLLGGRQTLPLIAVGLLLGIVPVGLGLMAWPAMRDMGPAGLRFLLALTVGLLAYLLADTLQEGLEAGAQTLGRLRGESVVWVVAAMTALGLLAVGRRHGRPPEGIALAFFVALGIGLHNLGEGLVVGAALATGAAALATFLVFGFILHNVTEGIAIAAALIRSRPPLILFPALAALAGLPAVVGVVAGAGAVSPYLVALCFGAGAGAILQVIIEITALTVRGSGVAALAHPSYAGGIVSGLFVMYATALLV